MASLRLSSPPMPRALLPPLLLPRKSHATESQFIFATQFSSKTQSCFDWRDAKKSQLCNRLPLSFKTDQTAVNCLTQGAGIELQPQQPFLRCRTESTCSSQLRKHEEHKHNLRFCFSCEPMRILCTNATKAAPLEHQFVLNLQYVSWVLLGGWATIENPQKCFLLGAARVTEAQLLNSGLVTPSSQITASRLGRSRAVISRRTLIAMLMAAVWFSRNQASAAGVPMEEPSLGNSLLRAFGVGDPDIYYPSAFEGTWDCYSRLVDVETPQGEEKVDVKSLEFSRKQLGYLVKYQARFIPFNGKVIGDRLFTTMGSVIVLVKNANMLMLLAKDLEKLKRRVVFRFKSLVESTLGKDVITGGIWSPDHPNSLVLMLRGGMKVENLVTKRSSEMSAVGCFDTSEYSKQVFDNTSFKDGPPIVKASQNITRYHWDPIANQLSSIEAYQRVAMFPIPGDKVEDLLNARLSTPITVYKYLVQFTRALDST